MLDIKNLQQQITQFSEERDWDQFHNGKDLAIGLSIEASELLEAFLWKAPEDVNVEKVKEELADVFNYALQIATKYDLDVKQIVEEKLAKNAAKYPVEKAKGVATKYDEL
jgi:NTP pyrophosphatase (non-canonical NTP hydrolase)